ncbi:MAG: murein transglycosylase [Rhodobacteraceae bacterium]|nr:murein transglycosylase [Paracoccaceae bacterium]
MLRALTFALVMLAGHPASAGLDQAEISLLSFAQLDGWDQDDHSAALSVFLDTCADLDDPEWRPICNLAKGQDNARTFFELFFVPVLIEDGTEALFTAYFEPVLQGARASGARFRYPVYRKPPWLQSGTQWLSRREIVESGALNGQGLEIAWVDDPVALQFLQIQGSGRIRLRDGTAVRLGYGGSNGHRFRSLGDELVRRGIFNRHQVSAGVISKWVKRNPTDGADLLLHNPSFVFFREIGRVPSDRGPLGAMNRSITAERSLAVDPAFTPLGAPVWLEKAGAEPFSRLMVAQDTGSRIKGAQRADIFIGTGDEAGRRAGRVRDPGRMVVLLPVQRAYALKPEG